MSTVSYVQDSFILPLSGHRLWFKQNREKVVMPLYSVSDLDIKLWRHRTHFTLLGGMYLIWFDISLRLTWRNRGNKSRQRNLLKASTITVLKLDNAFQSLKLTQCQQFLIRNIENRSKLFFQMVYWVNFKLKKLGSQLSVRKVDNDIGWNRLLELYSELSLLLLLFRQF